MAGHPVVLPSISFKTKTEAKEFFRAMLHRYSDGGEISPEDDQYLFEVIQRHPEVKDKVGVGINTLTNRILNDPDSQSNTKVLAEASEKPDIFVGRG